MKKREPLAGDLRAVPVYLLLAMLLLGPVWGGANSRLPGGFRDGYTVFWLAWLETLRI